ncbi:MAG: 50S ribosomal protein L28 [candidate division Zixibacteria bacterium]|nr:50S ribosomal protein L28 [candidate division Zixibacteria bacterium]
MARRCALTGKGPLLGNLVSHAHNKTRRAQYPNLQTKHVYVPELGRTVRIKMSAQALRSITKTGLMTYLKKHNLRLQEVI